MKFFNFVQNLSICKRCSINRYYAKTSLSSSNCTISSLKYENKEIYPPVVVSGMTKLDREKFTTTAKLPVLKVHSNVLKTCIGLPFVKKQITSLQKWRSLKPNIRFNEKVEFPEVYKFILLKSNAKFSIDELNQLKKLNVPPPDIFEFELKFINFKASLILKAMIPHEQIKVGGLQVGHIYQLALEEHLLPYKYRIGEVIIHKFSGVSTVVNKTHPVNDLFRKSDLEVIAGEKSFITTVAMNNCVFQFDFSKVFWNSRQLNEYQRITELASSSDFIFDVCSGVGPFSIMLAKKGCQLYANDLNPDSFFWLNKNLSLNNVSCETFNMKGEEFIKKVIKEVVIQSYNQQKTYRIIINLPGNSWNLITSFSSLIKDEIEKISIKANKIPKIFLHLYTFAEDSTSNDDFRKKLKKCFNKQLQLADLDVARTKKLKKKYSVFCLSFDISEIIFY